MKCLESDSDTYGDQLISIAILARTVGQRVLDKLQILLHERSTQLKALFDIIGDNQVPSPNFTTITYIQESIHWLILISASLLADAGEEILNIVSKDSSTVEINNYLSPRVTETLFWFFERWGKTYLLIDESDYSSISINIVRAFGKRESQGEGENILEYLIGKIKTNFILWNSDSDPLLQMVKLLNSYGKKSSLRNGLLHSSASDEDLKHQYFQMITNAIERRFLAVLQRPDFDNVYQQPDVMIEVQNALEMFDGLALASNYSNTQLIYSFCSKYFDFMVKLLHYYQSCPEVGILVLQFFNSFVMFQDFGELSKDQLKLIYQTIVELFEAYSSVNLGKKRLDAAEEEDEPYADISIILDMLSELMAAEFQGLSFDDLSKEIATTEGFDISNVIFYVARLSYHAITPLALYAHNEERKKGEAVVQHLCIPLDKFLQIVLECFLFKDFEAELLEPASETLIALICARKESYNTLVQNIISRQTSPEIQTRLHEAFSTLSSAIPQTLPEVLIRRRDVSGFREVLFRFLMNVRGFLRMK
ncbi:1617_t:CDS:10 [Diversispora eburnea]|uniref:1617_t:CDS:1 n=1 Tax=Diversispora eburnea TaxID=1213867 RepID=A0A9N8WRI5_9GLOM|nr:1617_t:CDS:10 [Diversispora eburnea]